MMLALVACGTTTTDSALTLTAAASGGLSQPTSAPVTNAPPTNVPTALPTTQPTSSTSNTPWLKVFFTDPNPPDDVGNGIDRVVVPVINAAKATIDVTSFDLNLPTFVNALVSAQQRGVQVRVVVDQKNGTQTLEASVAPERHPFNAIDALTAAGIPIVNGGRSNGLMHDKIIIVDSAILFMGSWNMSYNDTYRNNNNLLEITSQKLIANYQAKFNELFVDKRFGAKAQVGAQTASMSLDGTPVENYFSPVDNVMDKLVAVVAGAKTSVKFMAFTYTDQRLSGAMIDQAKAGVTVEGVIENRGASQGALPALFCAGIPVKTDGNKYTMHHKVIIIDDQTVITGSFNFTKSADDANDDNVVIIHNPSVAALYGQEFDKVYGAGNTPTTTC
jgi:phosphatidylserine/phosphatidylglycerophosphate/cardiolipin synthase-like enzyme